MSYFISIYFDTQMLTWTIFIAAPLDEIGLHILRYWKMKKNNLEIIEAPREKHINMDIYGIG